MEEVKSLGIYSFKCLIEYLKNKNKTMQQIEEENNYFDLWIPNHITTVNKISLVVEWNKKKNSGQKELIGSSWALTPVPFLRGIKYHSIEAIKKNEDFTYNWEKNIKKLVNRISLIYSIKICKSLDDYILGNGLMIEFLDKNEKKIIFTYPYDVIIKDISKIDIVKKIFQGIKYEKEINEEFLKNMKLIQFKVLTTIKTNYSDFFIFKNKYIFNIQSNFLKTNLNLNLKIKSGDPIMIKNDDIKSGDPIMIKNDIKSRDKNKKNKKNKKIVNFLKNSKKNL